MLYNAFVFGLEFPKILSRLKKVHLPEGREGNDWVIMEQ